MFDTLGKGVGALPDHLAPGDLAPLLAVAKARGLTVGLAGSLKARHVPGLLALLPTCSASAARFAAAATAWSLSIRGASPRSGR